MRVHPALAAWLPTATQIEIVELLTVLKPSGASWFYASSAANVINGSTVYVGSAGAYGLIWQRSSLTFKAGIELSECRVTLQPRSTDTINALSVAAALRAGIWDDATLTLSRAYFASNGTLMGVLPRYQGQLAPMSMNDGTIEITLKPPSQTFNRAVPPVYQAACINTLFDLGCGVPRDAYTLGAATQAGSTAETVQATTYAMPEGYLLGGVITFTSGALKGIARTIRQQSGNPVAVSFFQPLPQAPAAGDTFTLSPGCNRTNGANGCLKFNNIQRFRGTPYIPLPETAM